jgi:ferritin-like metal-binding protein YciE
MEKILQYRLKQLYTTEELMLDELTAMQKMATDEGLLGLLHDCLLKTEDRKSRLENICREYNWAPAGVGCGEMEAGIKQARCFLKDLAPSQLNLGLCSTLFERVYYKKAKYTVLLIYSDLMEYGEIGEKLTISLKELQPIIKRLDKLAKRL